MTYELLVFDDEGHILDGGEGIRSAGVVGLGNVAELDDVRRGDFAGLSHMVQHLAHAAGLRRRGRGDRRDALARGFVTHCA